MVGTRVLKVLVCLGLCWRSTFAEQTCNAIDDTDLLMSFMVFRHGDRTPEKEEMVFSDNLGILTNITESFGYGELTNVGKSRSIMLGKFLRRRYGQLLSSSYKASDIFVQCSDFTRCQSTAQIAITAAYSPVNVWHEDMELLPINCITTPYYSDPNLAVFNCRKFWTYLLDPAQVKPEEMDVYKELLEILSDGFGANVTLYPLILYAVNDLFTSQHSLGRPFIDTGRQLLPVIQEGAGVAAKYMFGNQSYVPLQAGVLLKEFFDTADLIISGANIPRVRGLSAHDFNVYSFIAATRAVPRQGVPNFCSVFSLELRKCRKSGKYVVVPVYVRSPEVPETYLEIENCGVICDYEKFRELTSKNVLNQTQYKKGCLTDNTFNKTLFYKP